MQDGIEVEARRVLRAERIRRRLSQAQAGALVGRTRKWISELENGIADPGAGALFALASALGVTVRFEPSEDVAARSRREGPA